MTEREILKQSIDEHQAATDRAKSELEELSGKFEIEVAGAGTLKMRKVLVCGEYGIQFCTKSTYGETATASIAEAREIRKALTRLISIAERS